MCGIVGIHAQQTVNQDLFDALTALQHRGQDAAGIATYDNNFLSIHKDRGLVREVFRTRHMYKLQGNMGIGHVRYPTAGTEARAEAQPFYVNSPYGIVLVHNGNLTNAMQLKQELLFKNHRHLNTDSDSEILLNIFAHELQKLEKVVLTPSDIFQAVKSVHQRCDGAYAVVAMIAGIGLLAFRDTNGIRPLICGQRQTELGMEFMIASESVALDMSGFSNLSDLAPGEAVFIDQTGKFFRQQCAEETALHPCLFELVYLSRPDSYLDKISVYKFRLKLGETLAQKINTEFAAEQIDVVMPIPDTSRPAAALLARKLGVKFREGFVKNRYIGRTFIMHGQKLRRKSVRQKLNTIPLEFNNKNVLLVDDSIVRGTTAKEIIQMARDAGAKKVFFASAAPEVRYPNVYGIDMPTAHELIAHNRSVEEIRQLIGADYLVFQSLENLIAAAQEGNPSIERFEDCVFTGEYITGEINQNYLTHLAQVRADPTMRELWEEET